jgi:hypothetical protein
MRERATRWLASLDDDRRAVASYSFDDGERFRWQYTPGPRGGLALEDMTAEQADAAMALLEAGLSAGAFAKARGIIALEPVLRSIEQAAGRPGWQRRDAGHYWFSVFGSPADEVWAWRVGGHHLCVHVTVVGSSVASLPLFLGANPATAPDGSRVLGEEEDLGYALLGSLSADQLSAAVVSDRPPPDILTGNEVRASLAAVPAGISYDDLTAGQRDHLARLVGAYTGRPAGVVPVDLWSASFAWLGSTQPGEGHYYAVRAGSLLIELDNTQNGANHVHTVVRDTERDWGEDLLAGHYRAAHQG